MPEKRCPSVRLYPSVRGAIDPETGQVLQVQVHCEGTAGHTGAHWNGHVGRGSDAHPEAPKDKTWED